VAHLPEFYCTRDLAEGSLVRVCAGWRIAPAEVWAITVSRAEKAPTVRAFLDLLRARLREGWRAGG
jgi:DNA-binding transcriptional LysR family regulator